MVKNIKQGPIGKKYISKNNKKYICGTDRNGKLKLYEYQEGKQYVFDEKYKIY